MDLLPDDVYYSRLNTVNLAAGALIRNQAGEVLVVNPNYRDHWLIPGGSVDKDEAPAEACEREIQEELGLSLEVVRLLSIEYLARRDYKPEAIHFTFDGGILSPQDIDRITLCDRELIEMKFCPIDLACQLLNASLAVRYRAAYDKLNTRETAYLERGNIVS